MTATGSALRGPVLWRLHVPPAKAPDILAKLEPLGAQWTLDWGGGLIWLALDGEVDTIRAAAETAGGQAMLVRAPEAIRGSVPAQHPRHPQVAALEARVRRAFDPAGIFETGRFLGEARSEEHTSELQSLMRNSYAVFCLKKKNKQK